MKSMGNARRFGGKRYTIHSRHHTRYAARKEKQRMKNARYLVRITDDGHGYWHVWTRS